MLKMVRGFLLGALGGFVLQGTVIALVLVVAVAFVIG